MTGAISKEGTLSPGSGCRRASRGFTLLEVLVAMVIVGLAVTALIQLFSSNIRAISASEDYTRATLRAEAAMRAILSSRELSEKTWTEFTADGYRMDVAVSGAFQERTETIGAKLYRVDLSLRWRRGLKNRAIALQTMKLVVPSEPAKAGGKSS